MTRRTSLNGTWSVMYGPDTDTGPNSPADLSSCGFPTIPAHVPGNTVLDLMNAGVIGDVSVGNRIHDYLPFEGHQWWYRRTFSTPAYTAADRVELVCKGLDTIAEIFINGQRIGQSANMMIEHRFDITAALADVGQSNDLVIRLRSSVREGRKYTPELTEWSFHTSWEGQNVRKASHTFGWDILPRLATEGIWRDIAVEVLPPTRWREVTFATIQVDAAKRTAHALIAWDFTTDRHAVETLRIRATLTYAGRTVYENQWHALGHAGRTQLTLSDVHLWWPRGSGEPSLYDLKLELLDESCQTLDERALRVGLRTAQLVRTETTSHETGGEFVFIINGEKVYVRGTNWVPLDSIHSRDYNHLSQAISMACDLNCNMLRCWGGNVYEDHAFFDACDEAGLMVWQDFALACHVPPQTDTFAAKIRAEAESVVRKLRHHASLVLWCGNNEIDELIPPMLALRGYLERTSRQVLADVTRRLDPFRSYLPSSPYRSEELERLNRPELKPEDHLWGPRGDFKAAFYTQSAAHFVSEIGYHGCPELASLQQMMDPQFVWPWQDNDQWITKCTRPKPGDTSYDYRIPLMASQIRVLFNDVPTDRDDFIFASQITQAEAVKFFIERWRMGKWYRTGMIWWNLRDGWPIISDAVVDYYNRKKLAYHLIKRTQTTVCAMIGEPGEPLAGQHVLRVVNDARVPHKGRVAVRNIDDNRIVIEGTFTVAANSVTDVGNIPAVKDSQMWRIDLDVTGDGKCVNHYLAGSRPYTLAQFRRWFDKLDLRPTWDAKH